MQRRVAAGSLGLVLVLLSIWIFGQRPHTPSLDGTLIYHRYTDYQSWDATMWMIDLPTGELTQVGRDWSSMISPINAHFSADGQMITFMGSASGLAENDWDVFTSTWNGSSWAEPKNLTGPNGARDEDPKFSPDGQTIIYKQDGVLVTMSADGSGKRYLTRGEPESSMPYFAANGKDILFERSGDIYLLRGGMQVKMYAGDGQSSYYPIGMDSKSFLYTRVQSTKHDAIMQGFYNGSASRSYFFNSTDWDTSDSYPYQDGSRYIFYVTGDYLIPHGGYNLAFADLKNEKRYDIDEYYRDKRTSEINSEYQELGPAWSPARFNTH
ncbi:unannotated protein [freshwater metagenome]|uniref:Unannotated protein n=1 Tax=freshwater metagenome TaxID=449393 RepID=A0A6J7HYW3_9ZZZZ|nr:hypothetical protein [Actinomycetota bacterium]